jgi:hypothetical protein
LQRTSISAAPDSSMESKFPKGHRRRRLGIR